MVFRKYLFLHRFQVKIQYSTTWYFSWLINLDTRASSLLAVYFFLKNLKMLWKLLCEYKVHPANICLDKDVLNTSSRRLSSSFSEGVFKTSSRCFKTSSRCLFQDEYIRLSHKPSRRLANTSSRHLQGVFKTSWRRVAKMSSRRFQDIKLLRCHQVKLFFLTSLPDVFNTCLRRTAKTVIYRRICLDHACEKFMVSIQNLQEWYKFFQVLIFHFTTTPSGCFQRRIYICNGVFFENI